ncbi:MAG TPA: SCO family protein [Usitatibacter sp.]|nr:SCO family protein [Usitatibacter sp.]
MRRAFLALLVATSAAAAPALRSGTFEPPREAPAFSLQGSNGASLQLASYRGKVVALGFGYTSCPDVCPATLADLAKARRKLGATAADFQVIYVTVDPERDDAVRLRKYLGAFDATFVGATGTPTALAEVRKSYGIQASRVGKEPDYFVPHSSYVYLVDRAGKLRAMVPFGAPVDDIVHDVNALLAQ